MNKCYEYKKLEYNDGIFNKTVDATYIIHLRNNGRINDIMNQLKEYHPTNIVYIVFNEGYKKCKKADFIKTSLKDIVDCNLNIFKHAKQNNYDNILVLEDDFIFNEKIKNSYHINNINNFLNNHKNEKFMYFLGCIPFMVLPYNLYTYKFVGMAAHSIIYSKNIRDKYLLIDQSKISDWDFYRGTQFWNYNYMYYKPLCYQLCLETENQTNWVNINNNILWYYLVKLSLFIIKKLKLDKQVEPGYTYVYFTVKTISFFIIGLIIYLSKKIIRKIT